MAEEQDDSQKTEDPTQKRLEEARQKGDIAKSQDVPIWFLMMASAAIMAGAGPLAGMIADPLTRLPRSSARLQADRGRRPAADGQSADVAGDAADRLSSA